jgi:arsenite-transporting ATPase
MRILFYTGKGGVGKTSTAAATGLLLAERGLRTLVMSLDRAHSLSDSFDLPVRLVDQGGGRPIEVTENLWIQEVDVLEEVDRHWDKVYGYLAELLAFTGVEEVIADEMAIIPGMEETSCLLYINEYLREGAFDVLILDCAPTGESLRFISIPGILRWYMDRLFHLERRVVTVARPVLERFTDIPIPQDSLYTNVEELFRRLEGVDEVLLDPKVTTVRIVTNPERMVVKESQRAFMYFCLYGLQIDGVVVNRVLPPHATGPFLDGWREAQARSLEDLHERFAGVPLWPVDLQDGEVCGLDALRRLGAEIYGDQDPTKVYTKARPLRFSKRGGKYSVRLAVPFVEAEDIDVLRVEDQLVVRVGSFRRNIPLPRAVPLGAEIRAERKGDDLVVRFG